MSRASATAPVESARCSFSGEVGIRCVAHGVPVCFLKGEGYGYALACPVTFQIVPVGRRGGEGSGDE